MPLSLTKADFVAALENTHLPQTTEGLLYSERTCSVCALGAAAMAIPGTLPGAFEMNIKGKRRTALEIGQLYGLTADESDHIIRLNDTKQMTFPEIAATLKVEWNLV